MLPSGPELIWPGKTRDLPSVVLPLQSVERFPAPHTGRRASAWINKLIWGDNLLVLSSLLHGPLRREIEAAGGLKLISIDPPFAVGADYATGLSVGEETVEEMAYRDRWGSGADSYLSMLYGRLRLMHALLAADGALCVHCDWRANSHIRLLLDEVFGPDNFLNEVIWKRRTGGANTTGSGRLGAIADTLLVYRRSARTRLAQVRSRAGLTEAEIAAIFSHTDENGRRYRLNNMTSPNPRPNLMYEFRGRPSPRNGWAVGREKMEAWCAAGKLYFPRGSKLIYRKEYLDEWEGGLVQNLWTDIPFEKQAVYATQKPEQLAERILLLSSREGDLVADFFCGSGTTLVAAERLGRKWIGCDCGRLASHISRKRLLEVQRRLAAEGKPYRSFEMLSLGRDSLASEGSAREPARSHPAASVEAQATVVEWTVTVALTGFDVSSRGAGPDLAGTLRPGASGVTMEDGQIVKLSKGKRGAVTRKVLTKHWTDWVDYWAVDFDHRAGAFTSDWQTFRTRRTRALHLTSPPHTYPASGPRTVAVKAIDIFGQEATTLLDITV